MPKLYKLTENGYVLVKLTDQFKTAEEQELLKDYIDFKNNRLKVSFATDSASLQNVRAYLNRKHGEIANPNMEDLRFHYDLITKINNLTFYFPEIEDFEDIWQDFEKKLQPNLGELDSLSILEKKLKLEKKTSGEKIELFVDALLKKYSALIHSGNTQLANKISIFCYERFQLNLDNLPEELQTKNPLTLASLILVNKKRFPQDQRSFIKPEFATMLDVDYAKLISENNSAESTRDNLVYELADFKSRRLSQGDAYINLFFQSQKFHARAEIDVANQLIHAIKNNLQTAFNADELETRGHGELGQIINRYQAMKENIVPVNIGIEPVNKNEIIKKVLEKNKFKALVNTFQTMIDIYDTPRKELIINSFNKISLSNDTDEEKIKKFADLLIIQYSKIRISGNESDKALAEEILAFCQEHLGINLPTKIESTTPLTLAIMLLYDKNPQSQAAFIQPLFADNLNQNFDVYLRKFDNSDESKKEKFILLLKNYESRRADEGDGYLNTIFQSDKYLRYSKLSVVRQLITALEEGRDTAFSDDEKDTLLNGSLGDLVKTYSNSNFLPPQLKDILQPKAPSMDI